MLCSVAGVDSIEVLDFSTVAGWFSGFEDEGTQTEFEGAFDRAHLRPNLGALIPSWTVFKCSWAGA